MAKSGRKRDEPIKRERKNSPLVGTGPKTKSDPSGSNRKATSGSKTKSEKESENESSARDRRHLQREKNLQKKKEEKENIPKKTSRGSLQSSVVSEEPEDLPDLEPNPKPTSDDSKPEDKPEKVAAQKTKTEDSKSSEESKTLKPEGKTKVTTEVPTKNDKNPTHAKMKKLESKINELSKAKQEGEMKKESSSQSSETVQKKKVSLKNLAAKPSPSSSSPSTPTPTTPDTSEDVKKSSGPLKEKEGDTDDDMPELEDAPVDVPMENDTPKNEKTSSIEAKQEVPEVDQSKPSEVDQKPTSEAQKTKLLPESFLKSPVKKQEVKQIPSSEVVQKTKPGAKIEEIFAKLDEKKLNEEMKKKKESTSGTSTKPEVKAGSGSSANESSQNAILNKILGKTPGSKPVQTSSSSIRNDVLIPTDDQMTSDDLSLPFESVPEVDLDAPGVGSEVTIEPGMEDEFSMTEATGTASPGASGNINCHFEV